MKVRLLLSTQRSGSRLVKSIVETRFPAVLCSGAVLDEPVAFVHQPPALATQPEFPHFWLWYAQQASARAVSVAPDRRMEAFAAYVSQLASLAKPRDILLDLKLNTLRALSGYGDTDHGSSDFADFVIGNQLPVLHLIRKNTLRLLVSRQLAREPIAKLHLNSKTLLADIDQAHRLTHDYQTLFRAHAGYEEIAYEDCATHLRALGHFLHKKSAPAVHAPFALKTRLPEDLSAVVENWSDVLRVLRGTPHAWMAEAQLLAAA